MSIDPQKPINPIDSIWKTIYETTGTTPEGRIATTAQSAIHKLVQAYGDKLNRLIDRIHIKPSDSKQDVCNNLLTAFYEDAASCNKSIPPSVQRDILGNIKMPPIKGFNYTFILEQLHLYLRQETSPNQQEKIYALILSGLLSDNPKAFMFSISKDMKGFFDGEGFMHYCLNHPLSMDSDSEDAVGLSEFICLLPEDKVFNSMKTISIKTRDFPLFYILFRGFFDICSEGEKIKLLALLPEGLQKKFSALKSSSYPPYYYLSQKDLTQVIANHYQDGHFGRIDFLILSKWVQNLRREDLTYLYEVFNSDVIEFCQFLLEILPKPLSESLLEKNVLDPTIQDDIATVYMRTLILPPFSLVGWEIYTINLIDYMESHSPQEIYHFIQRQNPSDLYLWNKSSKNLQGIAKTMPDKCIALIEGAQFTQLEKSKAYEAFGDQKEVLLRLREKYIARSSKFGPSYGTFKEIHFGDTNT